MILWAAGNSNPLLGDNQELHLVPLIKGLLARGTYPWERKWERNL